MSGKKNVPTLNGKVKPCAVCQLMNAGAEQMRREGYAV